MATDGHGVSKNEYGYLDLLLGSTHGGDSTLVGLPDLTGRAARGAGPSSSLGQKTGEETTTIAVENLPSAGNDEAYSNLQPTLTLNYMISYTGRFSGKGRSIRDRG